MPSIADLQVVNIVVLRSSQKSKMGLLALLVLLSLGSSVTGYKEFNVLDFGAVGDGVTDDSQAFKNAWYATCNYAADNSAALIVPGRTYLVSTTDFRGPCRPTQINMRILGTVIAPTSPNTWKGAGSGNWLTFHGINGFTLSGTGTVDGRGSRWWECVFNPKSGGCGKQVPTVMKFFACHNLQVRGIKFKNSPRKHLQIQGCQGAIISQVQVVAPDWSPNTDGIFLLRSRNVRIEKSAIGTGDDCIAIGDGNNGVIIDTIECGPGHGVSVGSLGKSGSVASVENIYVRNVNFWGTTNGARIKTWQGGKGYARSMSFSNLKFNNVSNPIIIDQFYCDRSKNCPEKGDAVKVSNITFSNLRGTSFTPTAVSLKCSKSVGCSSIHFIGNVDIRASTPGVRTNAYCSSVDGDANGFINPPVPCLE